MLASLAMVGSTYTSYKYMFQNGLLNVEGFVEVMVWKFDIGLYKDHFVELKELKQILLEIEYQTPFKAIC